MTKNDLIARLNAIKGNPEIMILDGFNGGGFPREINLGPTNYEITKKDADESGDCEEKVGKKVYVMGYGCY